MTLRAFKQNKLFRDKISNILEPLGSKLYWIELSDQEFQKQLSLKLIEEAHEVQHAKTKENMLEELADVLEVIDALRKSHGFTTKELNDCKLKKRKEKGGFDGKRFITVAEHPIGSLAEKYCLANPDKYPEIKNQI
jgi:predicted house-cleaning noncanonical NTP pyrophosphatase (MazG superfamily)